ncbi:MAG: amidohydrolase [Flavobacteriales bacterium]|jgi:amidohydrolase
MGIEAERVLKTASSLFTEIKTVRRHLHANPELSFEEHQTSAYITSILKQKEIFFETGFAGTGIIAIIEGQNPTKKTIALRADMDALPILETNTTDYVSKNKGVMHACGHDVHTACGLGALLLLNELKSEWEGTVRMLFQPGEELLPGGASLMIKEGALPEGISGIFGQHVFPELTAGKVGFRPGMYMASTDELYFTVKGKGGHGALRHKIKDPILAAANMISALHVQVNALAPSHIPTVFSIGKVIANGATNVIPDNVHIEGTFRTMDEDWRATAHTHIQEIAEASCTKDDVQVEIEIRRGYPFLVNDEALTLRAKEAAIALLGPDNVIDLEKRMTAEDFAYYSQHMPACFYRLGTQGQRGEHASPVHTSTFDIDESALQTGMALMAWLALSELKA